MINGHVDVDKIVMQRDWDEDRDMRRYGVKPVLEADEVELTVEEIINESY
jgi:hypothetical protein